MISSMNASGASEKYRLRQELELAMKEYKGEIRVIPNTVHASKEKIMFRRGLKERVRIKVEESGLSRSEMAEKLGISKVLLNKLISKDAVAKEVSLLRIAKKLGVSE